MDMNAARVMLADAQHELAEARKKVAHLEQVAAGLAGLLGLDGPGHSDARDSSSWSYWAHHARGDEVRPREAVLIALKERPGRLLTARSVYEWIEKKGIVNPEVRSGIAAYDMALRRLAEEPGSGVERDESSNRYIYRPSPSASSGVSDAVLGSGRAIAKVGEQLAESVARHYTVSSDGRRVEYTPDGARRPKSNAEETTM